jgi:hypothetical protein
LHSFTFAPIDETSEDVVFVGKDGVMHVGPIRASPIVCAIFVHAAVNQHGKLTIEIANGPHGDTTHLTPSSRIQTLHPAPPPDRTYTPPEHDIEVRVNRFQLSPRSAKARLAPEQGRRAQTEAVQDEEEEERKVAGVPRWTEELADDIGVVMRRRALDKYGLGNVSSLPYR